MDSTNSAELLPGPLAGTGPEMAQVSDTAPLVPVSSPGRSSPESGSEPESADTAAHQTEEAIAQEKAEDAAIELLESEVAGLQGTGAGLPLEVVEAGIKGGFFARFKKRKEAKAKTESVTFASLFRFGTPADKGLTILGLIASACGFRLPDGKIHPANADELVSQSLEQPCPSSRSLWAT
jgi:hypothetical protein